ncbi:hypothetical protein, partial [Acaryochloris sp. IP29b_bin.148]|uniref:hypothetical protein n=1 Tax=Acaryochloris sp. IP29b_bin.148 TaxID=2969218 RepID=UPI00263774A9
VHLLCHFNVSLGLMPVLDRNLMTQHENGRTASYRYEWQSMRLNASRPVQIHSSDSTLDQR